MSRQSGCAHLLEMLAAGALLVSGLLSGCAATTEPGPSVVQRVEGTKPAPPGPTGFLGSDYALLKPGKEGQVALVYFNSDARWRSASARTTRGFFPPISHWTRIPRADACV